MLRRTQTAKAMYRMADGYTEADATQHESFHDAQQEAREMTLLSNVDTRDEVITSALALAAQLGPDLFLLIEMAEMHWKNVRRLSTTDIFIICCCLAFIANPLDAIPDAIALIGLSDDIAVLAMTVHQLKGSINGYRMWKEENLELHRRGREEIECQAPTMCIIL